MASLNRRKFLSQTAAASGLGIPLSHWGTGGACADPQRVADAATLRVTGIETHQILLPYHQFNASTLFRYHGLNIQLRSIYVVTTNRDGLEGYGDAWGRGWPQEEVDKYVGTNPFDWLGDTTTLPINMAIYDLLGKYLGIPVWKLLGPQVRDRVPVAAWTVSQTPAQMAKEVQHAAAQGYRWLKYHVDEVQNVLDQTAAMQRVAPPGFKIHFDFNANASFAAVAPIVKKLAQFPIAGRIEDPLVASDPDGWGKLREMTALPIVTHHAPGDFMLHGRCDGHMSGHAAVGAAAKTAALAEIANVPLMLQNAGGTINQAFTAHQAAVFKMATMDHVNLARLWRDDVTVQSMPIRDGYVEVPQGPGLGVTLDRSKLAQYRAAPRPQQKPFLVRIRYGDGLTIFTRHNPEKPGCADNMRFLQRLLGEKIPGPVPAYDNDVITDFWDEPDSAEFQRLWQATADGYVTVRTS